MERGKMGDIKNCLECGKILEGRWQKKFCSRSCSTSYKNKKKGTTYNDNELEIAIKNSFSISQTLKNLNLTNCSDNYPTIRREIKRLNLDISHFKGRGCNHDKKLKNWDEYKTNSALKKQLVKYYGNKCQKCGIDSWFGKQIVLELHHIDGNGDNNNIENLKLLCPNCHSQTNNWRKH